MLSIRGNNSLISTGGGSKAVINAGGGLNVQGDITGKVSEGKDATAEPQSSSLKISSGGTGADIGSDSQEESTADINVVNAKLNITASSGAGIGSSQGNSSIGNIRIENSHVTLRGGTGATIGSGAGNSSCGDITVLNSSVEDVDSIDTGIGGGYSGSTCGNVTIGRSKVKVSNRDSACIGAGDSGECGNVLISESTVRGQSYHGACIGSGMIRSRASKVGDITIVRGTSISHNAVEHSVASPDPDAGKLVRDGAVIGSGLGYDANGKSGGSIVGQILISHDSLRLLDASQAYTAEDHWSPGIGHGRGGLDSGSVPMVDDEIKIYHGDPLTIHHGTRSNEAINVFINSMETTAFRCDIPNTHDLEMLLSDDDFVRNNSDQVDMISQLKTALEEMSTDLNQLKSPPLDEIMEELKDNRKLTYEEYPVLNKYLEESYSEHEIQDPDYLDDTDATISEVFFDVDKFIGFVEEYRILQPMLESVIIHQSILRNDDIAKDESIEILRESVGKTLDDITFIGTKGSKSSDASRRSPIFNAKVAMRVIDSAINYALGEATNVGAYLARLDYTDNNLNVEVENARASDSNMRDADMAKAMTEYTKNNVLAQASQSMLAQANQNLSGVLSLLQ